MTRYRRAVIGRKPKVTHAKKLLETPLVIDEEFRGIDRIPFGIHCLEPVVEARCDDGATLLIGV
jgi:hypothetical protein